VSGGFSSGFSFGFEVFQAAAPTGSLIDMEYQLLVADLENELDDLCQIERVTAAGGLQKGGTITAETRTLLYSGLACYVAPITARRDRFDVAGGSHQFQLQYRAVLPVTAVDIRENDILTVTTSNDADLVGRELEVRDVHRVSDAIVRRLTLHDLQG
jgi:hypothetical protein